MSSSRRRTCWASVAAASPSSSPSSLKDASPSQRWPPVQPRAVSTKPWYAKQRTSFGRPIAEYQGVSFKIARMEARAWTARQAWRAAAQKMLAGEDFSREASIAKMVAGDAAMDNARDATQVFGGAGFMNETRVARHYRDSKILEIGEGTTEVQLMLIARSLGLEG